MINSKYNPRIFGGVALRLAVCALSLVVLAAAIFLLMRTFEARKADDDRRALSQSDMGLQEAFAKLSESLDVGGELTGDPDESGANFSVTFKREARGDTLLFKIVSTGTSGSIVKTQTKEVTFRLEVSDDIDSSWIPIR